MKRLAPLLVALSLCTSHASAACLTATCWALELGPSGTPQQTQSGDVVHVYNLIDLGLSASSHVCTDSNSMLITAGCSGGGSGPSTNQNTRGITISFDGGGSALTSGATARTVPIPFGCTITGWTVDADQSGSIVFSVTKSASGTYPPTSSIVGSQPPTISSAATSGFVAQSGWTTAVSANDHIRVGISSVSTITSATLVIACVAAT